jgi:hypothetical protein
MRTVSARTAGVGTAGRLADAWRGLSLRLVVSAGSVGDHGGMPRRAVYVTGWVAVTSAATVIGLGAVGVVRGAVQGNDTVTALSQQQVTDQLQSAAPAVVASTTAPGAATKSTSPTRGAQGTSTAPSQSRTAPPSHPATTATPNVVPPSHPTSTTSTTSSRSQEAKSSPTQTEHSTPTAPPTAASTPTSSYQAFTSAGGTVFARCTSGNQVSGTATPNNGYRIAEQELGPDSHIKVEFVGNGSKITVQVACSGGTATASVRTESGD